MKKTLFRFAMRLGIVALAMATIVACDASNTGQPSDDNSGAGAGGAGKSTVRGTGNGTTVTGTGASASMGGSPANTTSTLSQNPTTCSAPSTCGGALDGTWQIASTCLDGDLAEALQDQMAVLPAACSKLFQTSTLNYSGTVRYSNGVETPNMKTQIDIVSIYTAACYSALNNGAATLNATACSSIRDAALQTGQYSEATCAYATDECRCQFHADLATSESNAYTVTVGQIVYANGDAPVGYCVSGTTLVESQTPADLGGLTVSLTLNRIGD